MAGGGPGEAKDEAYPPAAEPVKTPGEEMLEKAPPPAEPVKKVPAGKKAGAGQKGGTKT